MAEFFGLKFDFETISPKIIIKTLVNHQTTPNHPKKTQKKTKTNTSKKSKYNPIFFSKYVYRKNPPSSNFSYWMKLIDIKNDESYCWKVVKPTISLLVVFRRFSLFSNSEIENVKKIKFYTKINIRKFIGIVKKEEENTKMKKKNSFKF